MKGLWELRILIGFFLKNTHKYSKKGLALQLQIKKPNKDC